MIELTGAVIDRDALRHNYKAFRKLVPSSTAIMGVVKADAYGHGAPEIARVALENGCSYLAVARFSEVMELRDAGIKAPILLFGYCDPSYVEYMLDNKVTASVGSFQAAKQLSSIARSLYKTLKVHIKTDTGMGRIGVNIDLNKMEDDCLNIAKLPGLDIEGIYTHFANADAKDKIHANEQFSIFTDLLDRLKRNNFKVKLRHAANSAATIEMPETHLDMVRPGISQYGLYPSPEVDRSLIDLKPVLSLTSTVIQLKNVPEGFKVSYGSTFKTHKRSIIAVIPIGYADGYNRLLSSKGEMIINGIKAPVIGRVCMDLTMLDVTKIPDIKVGDKVTIIGTDRTTTLSADDIAASTNTINYEVTCSLTSRVKRSYIN